MGVTAKSHGICLVILALVGLTALWTIEDGFPAILSCDIHLLEVTYWGQLREWGYWQGA